MKTGPLLATVLAATGMAAVVYAFVLNASPYVSVNEAKRMKGDDLHVAGVMVPNTLRVNSALRQVSFDLKDDHGEVLPIRYVGPPPANLESATRVVAVGGYHDGVLKSEKLLLKCPSKYESETKKS